MTADRLLTPADLAERLQCSRSYAYDVIRLMKHVRVGRLLRVSEVELARFLAMRSEEPATAPTVVVGTSLPRGASRAAAKPTPSDSLIRPITPRTKPLAQR